MQRLEVSAVVRLPPEPVYEFLVDFPRYARYSTYLDRVEQHGEGGPGTVYDLIFAWWRLSYTARSEVTAVDPPRRIDWRTVKDIDARGHWRVEPEPTAETGPSDSSADSTTPGESETAGSDGEPPAGRESAADGEPSVERERATDEKSSADGESSAAGEPPADGRTRAVASRVYFVVEFDRSSASRDAVRLPRFVSFDAVLDRVIGKFKTEATTVVERVVADLEGEAREVELHIHEAPSL